MAGRVRLSQETPEVDSVNSVIKLRGPRALPPTLTSSYPELAFLDTFPRLFLLLFFPTFFYFASIFMIWGPFLDPKQLQNQPESYLKRALVSGVVPSPFF